MTGPAQVVAIKDNKTFASHKPAASCRSHHEEPNTTRRSGETLLYVYIYVYMRHCKHLQRSQSHSVELIFAPWLEKISGLTLVPN